MNPGSLISQAGWSLLSVDSQETVCFNGSGANAFDGDPATTWVTQLCNGTLPPPHEIQINLGASYNLSAFQYLPAQDGESCGWIKQYEFYVSTDGVNWPARRPPAALQYWRARVTRQIAPLCHRRADCDSRQTTADSTSRLRALSDSSAIRMGS